MPQIPRLVRVTLRNSAIIAGIVLSGAMVSFTQRKGSASAITLRTEYLVNPLSLNTRVPRLSWIIDGGTARGVAQTAYQILVASSAENLNANKGDLWDAGKVASNATNQIEYQGKPLNSRQAAFWKVRVWDQNGVASTWSPSARWSMGLLEKSDWSASWIGDAAPSTTDVSTAMLRKQFTITAVPTRATVYATALGVYELRINGKRVGNRVLAPEFTDYHTRTQYQAYDVASMLHVGINVIAATLGDGWYAGGIGLMSLVNKKRNIYGDHPRFLAQLEIANGRNTQRIVTDNTWRVNRNGPIRSSDILNGEVYDARMEIAGWDSALFDDKNWKAADVDQSVSTILVAQPNEPIRVTQDIRAIAMTEPKPGVYVFDLGQNMVGWTRLRAPSEAGLTVRLSHAEMLDDDGTIYTDNLRGAMQTDSYTARGNAGKADETFEPHFTYHGFRYVQVTGLRKKPLLTDLVGRQVNSALTEASTFETSSPLITKLWQNVRWTQRDNMIGIPTDCPQRDERLGWMGDIQVFVGTSIFNADMGAFFTKWMQDVRDAQTPDGRFADFSPQPFQKMLVAMKRPDFMGVPGWGDAGVVVPWRLWQQYGDKRQLAQNYESSKKWIEFIRSNNPELLWKNKRNNDYGDWLNSDTMNDSTIPRKGGEVPKPVFATMMFAYATDLVSKMAVVLGSDAEAKQYQALHNDIVAAFNKAYVTSDGHIEGNTQAGYALALHFDLLPESKRAAAVNYMLAGIEAYKGHMSTGFHSTYRMMLELSRSGHSDVAYKLVNNTTFPSWGYSIQNGATTIWERWDGFVKGRGFQDKGMNSFNHYAIGAVAEWMYRVVLGINNDDMHPGYEQFVLHPIPGGGLTYAKGSYNSIRGQIESSWKTENGRFKYDVTIPANTSATIYIPAASAERVTEGTVAASKANGVHFERMDGGSAVFTVQSGKYSFSAQ
ncbi:MAG: glycoside hydrolase family 78 protein [Gemmatimonadaceae bacterium]